MYVSIVDFWKSEIFNFGQFGPIMKLKVEFQKKEAQVLNEYNRIGFGTNQLTRKWTWFILFWRFQSKRCQNFGIDFLPKKFRQILVYLWTGHEETNGLKCS